MGWELIKLQNQSLRKGGVCDYLLMTTTLSHNEAEVREYMPEKVQQSAFSASKRWFILTHSKHFTTPTLTFSVKTLNFFTLNLPKL